MTNQKLKEVNLLYSKISSLKEIINNVKDAKCEWIAFSHGNGSERKTVCDDENIISKVRELLILENEDKLNELITEFKAL